MAGRDGRVGANGLSSAGPAKSSRNGLCGRAAADGANGLALALADGANGFTPVFGGGANGLGPPEWSAEPEEAAAAGRFESAGSQFAR